MPSMPSDNSLHATSTPWALRDYAVNRRSELRGSAVAHRGRSWETPFVAVGAPWHLHVMENVKLFVTFFSIFVWSHGALRNSKSPCQCRGIAVECDRGFTVPSVKTKLSNWEPFIFSECIYSNKFTPVKNPFVHFSLSHKATSFEQTNLIWLILSLHWMRLTVCSCVCVCVSGNGHHWFRS